MVWSNRTRTVLISSVVMVILGSVWGVYTQVKNPEFTRERLHAAMDVPRPFGDQTTITFADSMSAWRGIVPVPDYGDVRSLKIPILHENFKIHPHGREEDLAIFGTVTAYERKSDASDQESNPLPTDSELLAVGEMGRVTPIRVINQGRIGETYRFVRCHIHVELNVRYDVYDRDPPQAYYHAEILTYLQHIDRNVSRMFC